ncbi:MAG TPA: lanthionine synthetase LanC family protein [Candidatus Saccharimonadales bacterium]|nr:lanthionine synthetase LanC family protein [Candidatus Saccharimonadales bacterium]
MWFALSLLALLMLSGRRTAEKKAATGIDSMAMAWLQQGVAMPLIITSLFFAKFYWPAQLPLFFWELLALYVALQAAYLYCYYRVISIADISFVAPLMTLFSVGNLAGAYIILGQVPSVSGLIGAVLIMAGAWVITRAKRHGEKESVAAHKTALILVVIAIIVCSIFSNIEVKMLRMSNPTSYNFYTSLITVPFVILVTMLIIKGRRQSSGIYWRNVQTSVRNNLWPLAIVGVTYTINMLATYQAKVTAPNQAYVGSIKAASVLPVVILGVLFFHEKVTRKQWLGVALMLAGLAVMAVNVFPANSLSHRPAKPPAENFLSRTGESLINLHESSMGGWRFKSAIQAPHYQTDRDVGAASVGMGFLELAKKYPEDKRWTDAARNTATWLIAVSKKDNNGRYWPDYVDDNGSSPDIYTSFDDGSIGIGDFFWQLYEQTHDPQYKKVAIESLEWTFSQAEPYDKDGVSAYRWKWDVSDKNSPYYMGMGQGAAGMTYAFATCYDRLHHSDPPIASECQKYMQGSLNYIEIVSDGQPIPETGVMGQNGDTTMDSGYLSGVAGEAFMYLKLYQVFGDKQYLDQAEKLLTWLNDSRNGPMVEVGDNSDAWRLALDPQGGGDSRYATGFEEGAAGIGWVYLQAYRQTKQQPYLQTAEAAGNWLLSVATKDQKGGLSWHEDEHPANPIVHADLNNGAAGIGMFLRDLYLVSGQKKYQAGAKGALKWLTDSAKHKGSQDQYLYWQDDGGSDPYSDDPSWHWGLAGIIEFAQRMDGGASDIPGEQPAL